MTSRSGMGAPSAGALRMQRSRARARRGDVIAILEIGQGAIADLVALGWLTSPDRVDRAALTRALVGLVERAIAMRVTPSTGSEGTSSTRLGTVVERGSQEFSLEGGPGEVLGAAEIVEAVATAAEPTKPFELDPAELWGPRLDLWRWRMWAPEWGPRPDQEGCLVPDYLL